MGMALSLVALLFARDLLSMKCGWQCVGRSLRLSMHSCSRNWMDGWNKHHHSEGRRRSDGMMREGVSEQEKRERGATIEAYMID